MLTGRVAVSRDCSIVMYVRRPKNTIDRVARLEELREQFLASEKKPTVDGFWEMMCALTPTPKPLAEVAAACGFKKRNLIRAVQAFVEREELHVVSEPRDGRWFVNVPRGAWKDHQLLCGRYWMRVYGE